MVGRSREAVIDYAFSRGRQNETMVKEICVASGAAYETFRFKPHHTMRYHVSSENGTNWVDGLIDYRKLHKVFNETVAGFTHLYAYGVSKSTFPDGMNGRPIRTLENINCHPPESFNHERWCTLPCHNFPKISCTNKTAHSL